MRQALAGMLWSKQFYNYDVDRWLSERGADPFKPAPTPRPRNDRWHHMHNADVISMPDKWEYPWYAAWDLAFHVLALTLVDPDFGKQQLDLMLRERYLHPSGQIPAYEWNFGDVNPPVHAWATIFTYRLEKSAARRGRRRLARALVPQAAAQLHLVGEPQGSHRQQRVRGRLPRSRQHRRLRSQRAAADRRLPRAGRRHRVDGAVLPEHARDRRRARAEQPGLRATCALKFVEHYLWIASSLVHAGDDVGMWDEEDGFFYDVLRLPDGRAQRLKVRSMVGLLPLCAVTVFDGDLIDEVPGRWSRAFASSSTRGPSSRPSSTIRRRRGEQGRLLASVLDETKLRRVLSRMLDENEFLSPYGIRSLSRYHEEHPYVFRDGAAGVPRRRTCRRSPTAACSAATRTGAARSGCRSTA